MHTRVLFGTPCEGCGHVLPVQGAELDGPISLEEAKRRFILDGKSWIVAHNNPGCVGGPRIRRVCTPHDLVIYDVREVP